MEVALKELCINAPFATFACGHIEQTFLIDKYQDDLHLRIIALKEESKLFIHMSFDLLGLKENIVNRIKEIAKEAFNDLDVFVVVSCTHTHYGNDVDNEDYINYLLVRIKEGLNNLIFNQYDKLYYHAYTTRFDKVGKSRISNYETGNELLTLIEISSSKSSEDNIISLIIHNVHPTILNSKTPFFSAEFPGVTIRLLKDNNQNVFYSYVSGAQGDISTRFTRDDQTYNSVIKLASQLVNKIVEIQGINTSYKELKLDYTNYKIDYVHDFSPIDENLIEPNLTKRELETIENGKIMRDRLMKNPGVVAKHALVSVVNLGDYKLIFYPNEIFSEYLNYIDINKSILISYSNGYEPYILPIGFKHVTYEMFMDTLSLETKEKIVETLKYFGN